MRAGIERSFEPTREFGFAREIRTDAFCNAFAPRTKTRNQNALEAGGKELELRLCPQFASFPFYFH
jgi:hypothetical protein